MCWRCDQAQRLGGVRIPTPPIKTPHLDALVARLDAEHPNGAWPDPVRPGTDHLPTFGKAPKPGRWP